MQAACCVQFSLKQHFDYLAVFGRVSFSLYAHDRYVQRHGLFKNAEDPDSHKFVVPQIQEARLPFWRWIAEHVRPNMIALCSRNVWVSMEAISAGIGMGFIADHEALARGGFQCVVPSNRVWSVPLWLVTHVDVHRTEKVQAMLKCIKAVRPDEL